MEILKQIGIIIGLLFSIAVMLVIAEPVIFGLISAVGKAWRGK